MKHYQLKIGQGSLNSTSGNHLCGLILEKPLKESLPANFQPRRSDTIADCDILLSQVGVRCNGRTDFNDIDLYRSDKIFMNACGLKAVPSEAVFLQHFDDLPPAATHSALRRVNPAALQTDIRTSGCR